MVARESGVSSDFCIVLASCPDDETAKTLAEGLIGHGLAACVNILPGMTSVYRWEGRLERTRESLLLMKTRVDCFDALQAYLVAKHPYDVPEIVAVPIVAGFAAYLSWVDASVAPGVQT
jgi:periplasmic divalent cation tolerance protein